MITAERTHLKRLKRKRILEARVRCHGSVFNHEIAHKWDRERRIVKKVSPPQVVLPKYTGPEVQKKTLWQRIKSFFKRS